LRFYLCLVAGQMEEFVPGQRVLWSGVYRVHHDSDRLMHEASLRAGEIFPCCKRFEIGKNQISTACPERLPNG
jgi:hypothetical protein